MRQLPKHDLELAWAAGFYDGEGCTVCAKHKNGCRALHATVAQVDLNSLTRFHNAVAVGHISGPSILVGRRPIYTWRAYGANAQYAIKQIWPHLGRVKSEQASHAMLEWSFRKVNKSQGFCARGHALSIVGRYIAKSSRTECGECRQLRRKGKLSPRITISALDLRLGIREYSPRTPDKTPLEYHPTIET